MGKERNNEQVTIGQVLASCYFWFTLFFLSGLLFPVALALFLLTVLFDRRRWILHRFTILWSDLILFINPYWTLSISGREKIDPSRTYVMVSNHQSGADIIVLFKLHTHFKWVAKKGLFIVPFIGWNMGLNGYIPIERSRGRSKLQMMDRAAASIAEGNSVMVFPEGTRSPDGRLQPYKTGAFRLALQTGTDILPIVLMNTHHAIRKGGLLIHRSRIRLTILDPLPFSLFKNQEAKELAQTVFQKTVDEFDIHSIK